MGYGTSDLIFDHAHQFAISDDRGVCKSWHNKRRTAYVYHKDRIFTYPVFHVIPHTLGITAQAYELPHK